MWQPFRYIQVRINTTYLWSFFFTVIKVWREIWETYEQVFWDVKTYLEYFICQQLRRLWRPLAFLLDPKSTRTFEKCLFHWIRPSTSAWRLSCRKVWHKNSSGIVYTFDFSFNTFDAISCHLELLGSFCYSTSHRISGIGDLSFTTSIGTKVSLSIKEKKKAWKKSLSFRVFPCQTCQKIFSFDVLKSQTEITRVRISSVVARKREPS